MIDTFTLIFLLFYLYLYGMPFAFLALVQIAKEEGNFKKSSGYVFGVWIGIVLITLLWPLAYTYRSFYRTLK